MEPKEENLMDLFEYGIILLLFSIRLSIKT